MSRAGWSGSCGPTRATSAATRRWPSCTSTSTSRPPARTRPGATPESRLTCWPAARAVRTSPGSSWRSAVASAAGDPGGRVTDREVLAFDLYGTLVDPIAISGELGRVLGDSVGRAAAGLWRLKQLEYSFRLTAMSCYEDFRWVTARALDFALASIGAHLTDGQARRLVELYDHLQPFPDVVPALRALAGLGYEL